jgi:cell division protein FtsW (lipid II flippase)
MNVSNLRSRSIGLDALEMLLLVSALLIALWTARTIQQNSQEGLQRWNSDVEHSALQVDRQSMPSLIASWCQRNAQAVRGMLPKEYVTVCERTTIWDRLLAPPTQMGQTDLALEDVLTRWRDEVRDRSEKLREIMGRRESRRLTAELLFDSGPLAAIKEESASLSLKEEVFLEQQAADEALRSRSEALQRLGNWDKWMATAIDPIMKTPVGQIEAFSLWTAARSLDGIGTDAGSQIVRRHLSAASNAQKAKQLLKINDRLELLLVFHAFMTWLMLTVVRRPGTRVAQSLGLACLGLIFWLGLNALGGSSSPLQQPGTVLALACGMVVLWSMQHFGNYEHAVAKQRRSVSVILLPGWWLFSAIGWLLLWDQSLNFHPKLRFLALEQWSSWCIAAWLLPLTVCHSDFLMGLVHRFNAWWLSMLTPWQIIGRILLVFLLVTFFFILRKMGVGQYITGEMLKAFVVVTVAGWSLWKLPMVHEFWQWRQARVVTPNLLIAVAILLTATLVAAVTDDKGPLLVLGILMVVLLSSGLGWTTGIAMLLLGFLAMVLAGVDLDVLGGRLQAWRNPFTADHDDMARLVWFQAAASESFWGFGPGQSPWCGTVQLEDCPGLPLQLQSDYTFTAIKGWWGPVGSWLLVTVFSLWCFRIMSIAARSSISSTTPLALLQLNKAVSALRAHLLFITALLILLQTWVTVSGNLGWLPLTGVTWPLVSFGKSSLWFTSVFLGAWGFRREHD